MSDRPSPGNLETSPVHYFIGIDAGGTKTDYVLANGDREIARSSSGTIKLLRTTLENAQRNLKQGLDELVLKSSVPLTSIACTCAGLAGITVPAVRDGAEAMLRASVSGKIILCGDIEIALDAAFPGERGIVVIAGTGSNVAGRTADGKLVHAGGWGPALGDQGSGYWFGQHALRRLMRALDARESSMLLESVLKTWKLKSVNELVSLANQTPPPDFASLMPPIAECAEKGDALCSDLLQEGGELLADQVVFVAEQIAAAEGSSGLPLRVAFTGSVLSSVAGVREAMTRSIMGRIPKTDVLAHGIDPLDGALWRARKALRSQTAA